VTANQTTPQDSADFVARLDEAEVRLVSLATRPFPPGLSEPDPGGEERWDAARIWAHLAEFPSYWVAEARKILSGAPGQPVAFGRMAGDPGRIAAIERDRLLPPDELWEHVREGIAEARTFATTLGPEERQRLGEHPRRGPVTVAFVLDQFVATHLEEHAAQLERLAEQTPAQA
jgi:DinB superfamily